LNCSIGRNPPSSHEEWLRLLQLQESLHAKEMKTWQMVIQSAIELLRKVTETCEIIPNSKSYKLIEISSFSFCYNRLNNRYQSFRKKFWLIAQNHQLNIWRPLVNYLVMVRNRLSFKLAT
jgi:hypothetical protein